MKKEVEVVTMDGKLVKYVMGSVEVIVKIGY